MSNFYGNFAALAADSGDVGGVVEITLKSATWNGSTALNLSGSIASARGKGYYPRVISFGEVQRGFDVRSSSISPLEMEVAVADGEQDGYALKTALESGRQRGSAAAVYWVIAGNASDYATRFVGILDRWSYGPGVTTLVLRTDDRPLKSYAGWPLTKSEWPEMPTESIGLIVPVPYGTHNSSGLSGTGMLPCPCVRYGAGTVAWYVVCAGEAKSVLAVYQDGVAKTLGVDYAVNYGWSSVGKLYTIIGFLAGKIPAATAAITCDATGYEATGNTGGLSSAPTGAAFLNPVEQIRHFLVNWAEKEWTSGVWYTADASTLLDRASWALAAQWAERQQLEGAGYLGGAAESKQTGDVLNDWLSTWPCFRAYWTAAGRLGLSVIPLDFPGYRPATSPLLRTESEMGEGGSFSYSQDTANLTDQITGSYLYDQVQGQYLATLTVTNPDLGENVVTNVSLPWSIRRAV